MTDSEIKFNFNNFDNFGYIQTKLPKTLYTKLHKECLKAKNNKKFISGLTSKGIPHHYYVEKNQKELLDFVALTKQAYEKAFPKLKELRILTKDLPFKYEKPWINLQKENEFIPIHTHDGILSYNIWIKIPYDGTKEKFLGNFVFVYTNVLGNIVTKEINLSEKDEGTIIMFPSKLSHLVWPFHKNKKTRISIAGNILLNSN